MKNIILLLMLSVLGNSVFGQQKDEAENLVKEGIAYHDKGDYEGAINKYDKALLIDKDNLLALAEKALTLLSLEKYTETIDICQRAIEKHQNNNLLQNIYVTYGNAYDDLKKNRQVY